MKSSVGVSFGIIACLAACEGASPRGGPEPRTHYKELRATPLAAASRLLVRFKDGVSRDGRAAVHARLGARRLRRFETPRGLELVELPRGMTPRAAAVRYRESPHVRYAEPDYLVHAGATPDDPSFGSQWGLHNTGQVPGTVDADIDAPEAWDVTTGSANITIAVIDTGIDYRHADLEANLHRNEPECTPNGLDDDGNGAIDDCHGIDALNHDADPMDDHGHGTHVAGTIGAVGNNGVGVAGVAWNVRLLPCKFLGADGTGSISGAIACLEYVHAARARGVNVVATNNSWSGGDYSQALFDAIAEQQQAGILFIAAAGNGSSLNGARDIDFFPIYPASYGRWLSNVIAVAALDAYATPAEFSNVGRQTVHLLGPGEEILSTAPGNAYAMKSGTSMATPHVSGATALLAAQNPGLDWRGIRNLLLSTTDRVESPPPLPAKCLTQGRLNAHRALTCTTQSLSKPVLPITGWSGWGERPFSARPGQAVDLSAVNVRCEAPAGNVSLTVNPGAQNIALKDDGLGADAVSGDGIYSNQWTPATYEKKSFLYPNGERYYGFASYHYAGAVTAAPYRDISAAGVSLGLGDETSATLTSPFAVRIGDFRFTSLHVSANGFISLYPFFPEYAYPGLDENVAIPTWSYDIKTFVAPFWDDLMPTPGGADNVYWAVLGQAPNRELVIEWRGVRHYQCRNDPAATVTFQVVFFENRNEVLFNYADSEFGGDCAFADRGGSATAGVQVSPFQEGQFSHQTPSLASGTSVSMTWRGPAQPSLMFLSPNGAGANCKLNTAGMVFRWASSGITGNVTIEQSKDGGRKYTAIATNIPNTGEAWVKLSSASALRFRIKSVNTPTVMDTNLDAVTCAK